MRTDPAPIQPLRSLWQEAFGDEDAFLDIFFSTGFAPHRCCYTALDGQLAAALYWLDMEYPGGKLAYIYAVATAKQFRGRGLCRELMARTHTQLKSEDYAGAILVPQDEGLRSMYAAMGYVPAGGIVEFSATAAAPDVVLKSVSAAQWQDARRRMLPDAVQLGDAALAFLARLANFYQGENLLLAASREGNILHALELIGDASAAPGILNALGCAQGNFRTPGDGPFALFLPLTAQAPIPKHLGFAFD